MCQYENMTDDIIIKKSRQGDEDATEFLLKKYRNLVKKEARTLYLIGADSEDLIQEGMIGLFKAIRSFAFDKNTSFYTFAQMCISRQIFTAITASARKKHSPLNSYISIYSPVYEEHGQVPLMDTISVRNQDSNPEEIWINQEKTSMIQAKIYEKLSTLEKRVLELYLDGDGYIDIAHQLNRSPKSIDNAIQRIRKKLS